MTDIRPPAISNPSLFRAATQPAIPIQGDISASPAVSNGTPHLEKQDAESPALPAPAPNVIHPIRPMNILVRSSNNIPRIPSQLSLFAFRQESLRGNRVLTIPSAQELPDLNRVPSRLELPTEQEDAAFPVEDLQQVEENAAEHAEHDNEADRQGGNDVEAVGEEAHDYEEESVNKTAMGRVLLLFTFNALVLIAYVLCERYIRDAISVLVLFVVFNAFAVLYIIVLIKTKGLTREPNKVRLGLSIANTLALMLYIAIAFVKINGADIPLTPFFILGFILLFGTCCHNNVDPPTSSRLFLILEKVVLWAELFLLGLRADGVSFPWGTVFIPIYFALLVLAFSSVLIIFGSLFAFATVIREEGVSTKLVVGSLWYVLTTLYTGVWLALITKLITYLENGDDDIVTVLRVGIIHSGILFLFTLVFFKQLYQFQKFEIQSEQLAQEEEEEAGDIEAQGVQRRNQQVTFRVSKENRTNLVMISPTFYSFLKKHLRTKNTKEIEKLKMEVEKAKLEKYRRGLSMRVPYRSADPAPTMNNRLASLAAAKPVRNRNLDFSEGDIDIRRQALPVPTIKKENSAQASEQLCTICFDNTPNAVFMNCGHGGVCYECALENWKKSDNCILCRKKVVKILKIVHFKPLKVIKVVESTRKVVEESKNQ